MARIEILGADELLSRTAAYPSKFRAAMNKAGELSLYKIWEFIPEYPDQLPDNTYERTGTTGRTLGVDMDGNQLGQQPEIWEVKTGGTGMMEASFGTNLEYAPHVIGEDQQSQGARRQHWWTLDGTVFKRVLEPIAKIFAQVMEQLARWLDGQGG